MSSIVNTGTANVAAMSRSGRPRPLGSHDPCGLFLAPALAVLLLMVALPVRVAALLQLSALLGPAARSGPAEAVGLRNYAFLLSDPDLSGTGSSSPASSSSRPSCVQFLLGITVAYILPAGLPRSRLVFTRAMLPMMLCPIVVGFLWRYMFNSEWGVVNYLLTLVGVRQARLARRRHKRALGGRNRRHLDVDAVRYPARDGGVPRHAEDHQ